MQEIIRNQTSVGMRHRNHATTGSVDHGMSSALSSYFFGADGSKKLTVSEFLEFQKQLQREINKIEVIFVCPLLLLLLQILCLFTQTDIIQGVIRNPLK